MKLIFIRHGETNGNLRKNYIGKTDEPLCELGIKNINSGVYPTCDTVFSSPMIRCLSTAKLIYPHIPAIVIDDLRECDFGEFEGKNYFDLRQNENYIKWLESGGKSPFPKGESVEGFKKRCIKAFEKALGMDKGDSCAFVVHGGTIMAILEAYAKPCKSYYDYIIRNGEYIEGELKGKAIVLKGGVK